MALVSLSSCATPQPDSEPSRPSIERTAEPANIVIGAVDLLSQFRDYCITNHKWNTSVDGLKDMLLGICSSGHDHDEAAFPTYLALMEVVVQCRNTVKRFLDREEQFNFRGSTPHPDWDRKRIDVVVDELVGHAISLYLLSELHGQSHAK
jgi:hypothetical protein